MTETHAFTVTAGTVTDQVVAETKNKAVALFRERWDFADGPMPQVADIAVSVDCCAPEVWRVYRDGKPVSDELGNENECSMWIQKHQGQSLDWAMKYEGYSYKKES